MAVTDILVIGGGLMGCSTAYHLACAGARVILAERRARPGQETTARSGAIIRAHYGVPALVALAREANKRFQRFDEEVGQPCGFVPCGYSVLVDTADEETLRAMVAMHQGLGVNVSLITPSELQTLVPAIKIDNTALVAYEPEGGLCQPGPDGRRLC